MMEHKTLLLLLCAALAGCAKKGEADADESRDPVVYVKSEDAAMTAAIAKARSTLGDFKRALSVRKPGTERYAVKVGFPYGKDNREHIWVKDPELKDASVSGQIMNEPVDVPNLKFGQQVTAPAEDISDWMYVEAGVLRGGYTMRVLLDKMSPEEKQKMLGQLGVKLD
jgi:uncharacterized protein YegJ (DUF2314 family)